MILRLITLLAVLFIPAIALGHHPGALGSLTHLGPTQIIAVIKAAALDSVNPMALGVLLLLIYGSLSQRGQVSRSGLLYVLGIFTTYFLSGFLIRHVYLDFGPTLPVQLFEIIIALFLFFTGLNQWFEALNPKKGKLISLPKFIRKSAEQFRSWLERGFAYPLGIVIGWIELLATGATYLTFIQLVTYNTATTTKVVLITIYLCFFMLPLLVILFSGRVIELAIGRERFAQVDRLRKGILGLIVMLVGTWIAALAYTTIRLIS